MSTFNLVKLEAVNQLLANAAAAAIFPPIVALSITTGTISTPLDGSAYVLTLSANVTTWSAEIPSGGNAITKIYHCTLKVLPPLSGGPFTLSIPTWNRYGGLSTISLSSTDKPIIIKLSSNGTNCDYTAVQQS